VILLTGFSGRLDSEALQNPKIWVPILGEAQDIRLQRISFLTNSASSRATSSMRRSTIRSKPIAKSSWRLIAIVTHWSSWAIVVCLCRLCLRSCCRSALCWHATITSSKDREIRRRHSLCRGGELRGVRREFASRADADKHVAHRGVGSTMSRIDIQLKTALKSASVMGSGLSHWISCTAERVCLRRRAARAAMF
jgi:hypothetical protein